MCARSWNQVGEADRNSVLGLGPWFFEDLAEDGALERLELKAAAELKPYGAFCSHVNLCGALEN